MVRELERARKAVPIWELASVPFTTRASTLTLAQQVDAVFFEQLGSQRRDAHPGRGRRPSSSDLGLSMRMAVAFCVTVIPAPEVHPELPPLLGTLARPAVLLRTGAISTVSHTAAIVTGVT